MEIESILKGENLEHCCMNYLQEILSEDKTNKDIEVYERREEFKNSGAWKMLLTVLYRLKEKNDKLKSQILG